MSKIIHASILFAYIVFCSCHYNILSVESVEIHNTTLIKDINFMKYFQYSQKSLQSRLFETDREIKDTYHKVVDVISSFSSIKTNDIEGGARTFGRIKRLQAMLIPVMFKLGVLSVLIVLLLILVVKSVLIGKAILVIQLITIAVKLATLKIFSAHSGHHDIGLQKEVHLHIHNSGDHGYDQHPQYTPYGQYSRSSEISNDVRPKYIVHREWQPQVNGLIYNGYQI